MSQLFSICIEDTTIRLLGVERNQVRTHLSLPLQPGVVKNGLVVDKPALVAAIKEVVASAKMDVRRVAAGTSGIHSIYRSTTLPRLSGQLMTEAVKREAERVMPVSLEDLYLSWQVYPASEDESLVCLLGLPRTTVDSMISALREAGLDPYVMDTRPLAAALAAGDTKCIVIYAADADFDIIIVNNGIPDLILSLGFSHEGLTPEDKAIEIREELERTIRFYNSSHEGAQMAADMPVVFGGDPEIVGSLSRGSSYPVKNPMQHFSFPDGFDPNPFLPNIGLILKGTKGESLGLRLNLNTLPEQYRPKPVNIIPIVSSVVVLAGVALTIFLAMSTVKAVDASNIVFNELSRLQTQVDSRVKGVQNDPKQTASLEGQLKTLQSSIDNVKKSSNYLQTQREKVSIDIGKAVSLLPATVTFIGAGYGSGFSLEGIAPDQETIMNYAANLKDTNRFSQVLVSFNTLEYHRIHFTINMALSK